MIRPNIVVFATGGKWPNEWWSGFKELKFREIIWSLEAKIVAVVSSHQKGWVFSKAAAAWVPFIHMEKPFSAHKYWKIVQKTQADMIALSWRINHVEGIDPTKCINIHPGPLGKYGGKWMYGHHVHEKIYQDFKAKKIKRTCVTMHFVTPIYDDPQGLIFQHPIELEENDTPETIAKKVNKVEHQRQRYVTNLVAKKEITATRDEETQKIHIEFPQDYQRNIPVTLETKDPYENF